MRIGIDGYNLALRRGTGVATYARTLARTVKALGCELDLLYGIPVSPKIRPEAREALFFWRLGQGEELGQRQKFNLGQTIERSLAIASPASRIAVPVPISGQVVTNDFADRLPEFDRLFTSAGLFDIMGRYFRRHRRFVTVRVPDPPAVMHWTYPVPVRLAGAANIYTIHDLVPLRLPHTSLENKAYYDALIRECARTASHLVTVSEASRRDIVEIFRVDPARVTNTYQPVDIPAAPFAVDYLSNRLQRLFDLDRRGYFMFFGAIEPKKNVGRLIEAYLSSGSHTPLVIVGAGGWRSDEELRLLNGAHGKRLVGAERIRTIDYLPRPLLMELAAGARAVLFPSLHEGFGLPVAEALALGTPVITSNAGSLPEVAGEAALQVDPYDVDALTEAVRRMDNDEALRTRLEAAGPKQAEMFSAERYRRRIADLYQAVSAGGGWK